MDIEIVTIGTELLLGHTLDTNGAEIARTLAEVGVRVVRRTSVADCAEDIRDAVREALERTGAALTTGGLGPTRDDVTKRVVAELFRRPLEFDEQVWADLLERFRRLGRNPAPSNRTQAEVPRGATVLRNRWGTAPGLWLESSEPGAEGPRLVIMLPGVPLEMRNLLRHAVAPRLAARAAGTVVRSAVLRTTGVPESTLADRIGDVEPQLVPLTLAYLPGLGGVDLRLTAWNVPGAEADLLLARGIELLRARAGEHAYGEGDVDLAAEVLQVLRERRLHLAVAESCTGGLLGARLTEIPGSSDVFTGGVIAYDNRLKRELLGVPETLLREHGAVSEPVARAMAEGALARLGVETALSVTGIAGPSGGSEEKPVGSIWLAVAVPGRTESRRSVFPGSRFEIRARAAQAALFLLWRRLREPA